MVDFGVGGLWVWMNLFKKIVMKIFFQKMLSEVLKSCKNDICWCKSWCKITRNKRNSSCILYFLMRSTLKTWSTMYHQACIFHNTFNKKNITQNRKTFITEPKRMIFWWNKNFLQAYNLLLLFLKQSVFFLGVASGGPIFVKVLVIFFRNTGFQSKLLILIEHPNIFHWNPTKKIKMGMVFRKNLGQIRLCKK